MDKLFGILVAGRYMVLQEVVDEYFNIFLKENCPKVRSLQFAGDKGQVLRRAADVIEDGLEFRLVVAGLIKTMHEDDWDQARDLFVKEVVKPRYIGRGKRMEKVLNHLDVEILQVKGVKVVMEVRDFLRIVITDNVESKDD